MTWEHLSKCKATGGKGKKERVFKYYNFIRINVHW